MKFFKPVVIILLCISLFFNVRSASKMEELEHRMMALSNAQTHTSGIVAGHTGSIRNMLDEFKREQSWMGYIDANLESVDPEEGQGIVAFEWQVKELSPGAVVTLHYKKGDHEYQKVTGIQKGAGIFEAKIPVEIKIEPEWVLSIERNSGNTKQRNVTEAITEAIAPIDSSRQDSLEYYISVESGQNIKNSDRQIFYPGQFGRQIYGHIDLRVFSNTQNAITVFINDSYMSHLDQKQIIEEAWVRQYSEQTNQLVLEKEFIPMEIPNYHRPTRIGSDGWVSLENVSESDFGDLFAVVVKFDNGATFTKEFYIK